MAHFAILGRLIILLHLTAVLGRWLTILGLLLSSGLLVRRIRPWRLHIRVYHCSFPVSNGAVGHAAFGLLIEGVLLSSKITLIAFRTMRHPRFGSLVERVLLSLIQVVGALSASVVSIVHIQVNGARLLRGLVDLARGPFSSFGLVLVLLRGLDAGLSTLRLVRASEDCLVHVFDGVTGAAVDGLRLVDRRVVGLEDFAVV